MVEFLSIEFLIDRKFKDASENEVSRLYKFGVPYGAPFEEIKGVVTELAQRIDVLEKESKEREAAAKADAEKSEEVSAEVVS